MLFRPLLSFFPLVATAVIVGAAASSGTLALPHLFSLDVQISADQDAIIYPYGGGVRVNVALPSGSLATPANGTIAALVPGVGGEQGIIREDGVFIVDARLVFQVEQSFDPDRRFAFLQARGKSFTASDDTSDGLNHM